MPWSVVMNVWRYYEEWVGNLRMSRATGTVPERVVARSHHRANRTRSGTVPLRSHRDVVGSFRNDRTQWNSAGTSTTFLYLSKSTSNREKSYSSRSKSTPTKMYLKYKYKVKKCTWSTDKTTLSISNRSTFVSTRWCYVRELRSSCMRWLRLQRLVNTSDWSVPAIDILATMSITQWDQL